MTVSKAENKFTILMTGLCAFVPKKDIRQVTENNQMRVLMVESSSSADIMDADMAHAHESHVPVLIAPRKNVCDGDAYRQPDLVYYGDKLTEQLALFYLEGQDLKISGAQDCNLTVFLEPGAGNNCPHRHIDSETQHKYSFDWVPGFDDISPGSQGVDEACLSRRGDPSVAARIELRDGEVYTYRLGVHEVFLWQYKAPNNSRRGSSHRQAAAQLVGFDTSFGEAVELLTSCFRRPSNPILDLVFQAKNERTIKLIPQGGEEIFVLVENMPWADILHTREPADSRERPDIHFAHLYKILLYYNDLNVPHFYDVCPDSPKQPLLPLPFHQGSPNCQPVRTAPNEEA
jgi:hypothetical protein